MKRQVSMEEISDGRLYDRNDMVRAGCRDCKGCSECCHGMGESIILDPYDVWRLTVSLEKDFSSLLAEEKAELNVVDGIILPNLKMNPQTGACGFLNGQGRCSIHPYRPGVCRLFPLGRFYENESFRYFLQVHECPMPDKTKVKVEKWVDTPQLARYEAYIKEWHYFLEAVEQKLPKMAEEDQKNADLFILKLFFLKPYTEGEFYPQFAQRMEMARDVLEV